MTALQVAALLYNGTGVIYVTDTTDTLASGDGTGLKLWNFGWDNTPDRQGYIQQVIAENAKVLGNRAYHIFLDPRPVGVGPGNSALDVLDIAPTKAVDITDVITVKGMQEPAHYENVVVAAHDITYQRVNAKTILYVDGGGAYPASRVDTFTPVGAEYGDIVTINGITAGNSVTLTTAAFGYLEYDITLSSYSDSVTFQLNLDGNWAQVVPNKMDAASLRAQGVTIPAQPGTYKFTPTGGTQTIYPGQTGVSGAGTVYEHDISLQAGPVVLASSLEFTIDLTDALDGDSGTIDGNLVSIDLNGNAINFNDTTGTVASMNAAVADQGAWTAQWKVCDINAVHPVISWVITPSIDTTNAGIIDTISIADQAVTNGKIADATIDGSTKLVDYSVTEVKLSAAVDAKLNALNWVYINATGNQIAVDRYSYNIDATAANLTVFLPEPNAGAPIQIIRVRKADASVNTVTVDALTNTIDGAGTVVLAAQYDNIEVEWNGSEWFINT